MNLIPTIRSRPALSTVLTVVLVGLSAGTFDMAKAQTPPARTTIQQQHMVKQQPAPAVKADPHAYHHHHNHWWNRHKKAVAIGGGAAGGALIGGVAGGGTGALLGGAIGAGGGYLYHHFKKHH